MMFRNMKNNLPNNFRVVILWLLFLFVFDYKSGGIFVFIGELWYLLDYAMPSALYRTLYLFTYTPILVIIANLYLGEKSIKRINLTFCIIFTILNIMNIITSIIDVHRTLYDFVSRSVELVIISLIVIETMKPIKIITSQDNI